MTIFSNPDDDPRIWGEDPDWDERMRQYHAELAEERWRRAAARRREDVIMQIIDEVLLEAKQPFDSEMMRRRLRQAYGLSPKP